MNKNIVLIALIFFVPLCAYFGLTRDAITAQPVLSSTGDELIKFGSPICSECNDLEKVINQVMPKYTDKVTIRKIDVTKNNKECIAIIKEYDVKLVPTTIFKNQDGRILRRVEGTMKPDVLESYVKELINE